MKSKFLAILAAVGMLAGPVTANALPITYDFSGTIGGIIDASGALVGSGIDPGTVFEGTFSYDPEAIALGTGPAGGGSVSDYPSISLSAVVGGSLVFAGLPWGVQIGDNVGSLNDYFSIAMDDFSSFDAPNLGSASNIQVFLWDTSELVFGTSSLPATLDLAAFNTPRFYIRSFSLTPEYELISWYQAEGTITSLTLAPASVPEPGTLALLGLGLAGLGFSRRKKLN